MEGAEHQQRPDGVRVREVQLVHRWEEPATLGERGLLPAVSSGISPTFQNCQRNVPGLWWVGEVDTALAGFEDPTARGSP
jgi:hypothetical protein